MLSGYKTYILGGVAIISALGAYLVGNETLIQAVQIIVPAALSMTVRHGMTTDAAKTAAATAVLVAPVRPTAQQITDALNSAQLNRVASPQPR